MASIATFIFIPLLLFLFAHFHASLDPDCDVNLCQVKNATSSETNRSVAGRGPKCSKCKRTLHKKVIDKNSRLVKSNESVIEVRKIVKKRKVSIEYPVLCGNKAHSPKPNFGFRQSSSTKMNKYVRFAIIVDNAIYSHLKSNETIVRYKIQQIMIHVQRAFEILDTSMVLVDLVIWKESDGFELKEDVGQILQDLQEYRKNNEDVKQQPHTTILLTNMTISEDGAEFFAKHIDKFNACEMNGVGLVSVGNRTIMTVAHQIIHTLAHVMKIIDDVPGVQCNNDKDNCIMNRELFAKGKLPTVWSKQSLDSLAESDREQKDACFYKPIQREIEYSFGEASKEDEKIPIRTVVIVSMCGYLLVFTALAVVLESIWRRGEDRRTPNPETKSLPLKGPAKTIVGNSPKRTESGQSVSLGIKKSGSPPLKSMP